jgi:hypothetical protein
MLPAVRHTWAALSHRECPGQPVGGKSSLGERGRLDTKLRADTIVVARNGHEENVATRRIDF